VPTAFPPRSKPLLGLALALAASLTASAGNTWPQWRGPTRDGTVGSSPPWPSQLDEKTLQRRWHIPLGPGYSGPLITRDHVFVTEAKDQAFEAAIAVDRATGQEVWRHQWEGYVKVPFFAKSNGDWIRSTPALANGRLYVGGMRDVVICLEAATGKELWRFDFPKDLQKPLPDFGLVSSPLVAGDALYVQAGAGFAKLQAESGKLLWRTLDDGGGMWGSAFSSPILATMAGKEQLIVQTRDKLAAVQPSDGKVLWEQTIKSFRGMNILTPVSLADQILTSSYGGQTQGWTVSLHGDTWKIQPEWNLKLEAYMSTPVVHRGHAFLHTRSQHLACVDLATGTKRWQSEQKFGKYLSLVLQGNQILALDERGILLLFPADPDRFAQTAERRVSDSETWAHLAVADTDLAIRDIKGLAVWSWISESR